MNLVNEDLIKQHGLLSKVNKASFKLVGITGLPLQVLGVIRQAPIVIKETVFEVDLVVTSKLNEACILGQSFFEKYKFILNFNDKTLSNSSISAQLTDKVSLCPVLTLRCKKNHFVSGMRSISCCMFEGEKKLTDHSGAYLFKPTRKLAPLVHDQALFEKYEEPILVEDGETYLAFSCDDQAKIWLPKGYILGHVIPAVQSASLADPSGSDSGNCTTCTGGVKIQYGWEDTNLADSSYSTPSIKQQPTSLPNCDHDVDSKSRALLFDPSSTSTSPEVTVNKSLHSPLAEMSCSSVNSVTSVPGNLSSDITEHVQPILTDKHTTSPVSCPTTSLKTPVCISISLVQVSPPPRRKTRKFSKSCLSPVLEEAFQGEKSNYFVRDVTVNGSPVMIDRSTVESASNTSNTAVSTFYKSKAPSVMNKDITLRSCILSVPNDLDVLTPSALSASERAHYSPSIQSSHDDTTAKTPKTVQCNIELKDGDFDKIRTWLTSNIKEPDKSKDRSNFSDDLNHYHHLIEHLHLSKNGAVCFNNTVPPETEWPTGEHFLRPRQRVTKSK